MSAIESLDQSLMVNPLSYFSFQPVLHDWFTKDHTMCHHVCGIERLAYVVVSVGFISCSISGYLPCLTPDKYNLLRALLNKRSSFLL